MGTKKLRKWDLRYLHLAKHISLWSKDPNKQVGAVIVGAHYITGIGYNGLPRGLKDTPERLYNKDTKLSLILHAEENALLSSGNQGKTIYTYPCMPCTRCLAKILQTEISRIVSIDPAYSKSSWKPGEVNELAEEAGLIVTLYSSTDFCHSFTS